MKLPDFSTHPHFVRLLHAMGITQPTPWNSKVPKSNRTPLPALDLSQLSITGIDVDIGEIQPSHDGTLIYQGERVLVYIRDQELSYVQGKSEYKFHVADCNTLREMRAKNRFNSRYVATNRRDGIFLVNRTSNGQIVEENREVQLHICKNCLSYLNYSGYTVQRGPERQAIYDCFSLDDFFTQYSSTVSGRPTHNEYSMPLNVYPGDWRDISKTIRRQANWQCEGCGVQLADHTELLHTHHRDGNKSNNGRDNLQALCVVCHSHVAGHERLQQLSLDNYNKCLKIQASQKKG